MKQTITKTMFRDLFKKSNDSFKYRNGFTYEGLGLLYDYLESCDRDYELDVIELCCEFNEEPITEALSDYKLDSLDQLHEKTTVIQVDDDNIIYRNF